MKSTLIELHGASGICRGMRSLEGLKFEGLFLLQEVQAFTYVATYAFIPNQAYSCLINNIVPAIPRVA